MNIRYKHFEHLQNEYVGLTPDDDEWNHTVEFLMQQTTAEVVNEYQRILKRPYMGCGLYNRTWKSIPGTQGSASFQTRDPDEYEAMILNGFENVELVGNGTPNLDLFSAGQPYLGTLRSVASVLNSQAYLDFQAGNHDLFADLLESVSSSTKFLSDYPTHFDELVARALEYQVNKAISWALDQPTPLTEDLLVQLDAILSKQQHRNLNWEAEQLIFHDTVRRLVDTKGKIIRKDYEQQLDDLLGPQFNGTLDELSPDAQRLILLHDSLHELFREEAYENDNQSLQQLEQIIDYNRPMLSGRAELLLAHRESSLSLVFRDLKSHLNQTLELRYQVAALRHTLRHGSPPQTRSTIDTDLLPD